MVNDPIGDMLIQIKNAALAGKNTVELPHSQFKEALAKVLVQEGFLESVDKTGNAPKFILKLVLVYKTGASVITGVSRISKPGLRVYVDKRSIPLVVGGMGVAIVSTPLGLLTGKEAKKKGIGGELLCEIW